MSSSRQLAAIMFTDIEGYTSLMNRDEEEGIELRIKHRKAFESTTEAYHGTVVQYFGDGTLSIFKSTVEAIDCAIELQKVYLDLDIPVRIGIHVGDIVLSNDDIIGDAVNVASRIESGAIPGSILISDKVHDQVRNHRHIQTVFLDAFELKNVDGTTPVFAISNEFIKVPTVEEVRSKMKLAKGDISHSKSSRKIKVLSVLLVLLVLAFAAYFFATKEPSNKLSIAVLPFSNLSLEENSDLFRDGITEDILTNLSRLHDLHVISKTSVMKYKDSKKTIPEIAEELGVTFILEGSIRMQGNQIRVTAQLIDAKNDEFIWAEDYDKTLTDIFLIQSQLSEEIVEALQLSLTDEQQAEMKIIPTKNIEAYQLFLKGKQEADKRTKESIEKSIDYYNQALALDPNYAEAYAEIANSTFLMSYYANADPEETSKRAKEFLEKAEKINDRIARIYTVKGLLFNHEKNYPEAEKAFEKAIFLSPNDITARHQYATYFYYTEQFERQLEQTKIAYSLDPLSFATASSYFNALVTNGLFEEAEKMIEHISETYDESDPFIINRLYMRLYMSKPDYKKAIKPLRELVAKDQNYLRFLGYSYGKIGDTAGAYRVIDSIRQLPFGRMTNHRIAVVFAGMDVKDSVFYYLDSARNKSNFFDHHSLYYFDSIKKDPRYNGLLKQHELLE